ncbi:type I glyceraldehyde-3-phosphate dehydrogenase [Dermatophilaceae bacterium Sec6.4]|nr:type I glyceraldehyde-3-phosphate dehydrogenase [Actinomycetota bacterium]
MTTRIAINGFGRTGRALYRAILERHLDIQIVAINDLGAPEALARLVRRDSVHGRFPGTITVQGDDLVADGHHSRLLREPDVEQLPWKELGVQVVAECTGRHRTRDAAAAHLGAGAERVVVSAPCKEADATFVIGVNDHEFDPERHIVVSNASCTTNCFAPMAKVLQDAFGIESGLMTTVHAYTGDQLLIDGLHKDPRRARSAALNIVPTSTGAARAASLVLPSLEGRFEGVSLRVPIPDGSITDFVALLARPASAAQVNAAFLDAASGPLGHVLEYSQEPLVSTDVVGSAASCIFDSSLTLGHDRLVKVFGWYDNEWGYSNRLAEMCMLVGGGGQ